MRKVEISSLSNLIATKNDQKQKHKVIVLFVESDANASIFRVIDTSFLSSFTKTKDSTVEGEKKE